MAATPQRIVMPFSKGVGADADSRIRPAEHLLKAVNCYHDADGLLVKRNGFTKLASRLDEGGTAIDAEGPIRGLAHTDTELLAIGHRTLYGWSPEASRWINRGRVSPCIGATYERFRGASQYRQADMSVGTNYIVYAAARRRIQMTTSAEYAIEIEVRSANTGEVVYTQQLLTTSTANQYPLAPRLFAVPQTGGGMKHYLLLWYDETLPSTLKLYSYDEAAPFTAFAFVADISTDLYTETSNREARTFDGIAFNGAGNYAVGFIDATTNALQLRTYDDTDSLVNTSAITPSNTEVQDYVRIAIEDGGTRLYVIGVLNNNVSNIPEVHGFGRTTALAADWGATTLDTLDVNSYGDNVAVRQLNNSSGTARVVWTWCHADSHINNGATVHFRAASCTTDTGGTLQDAVAEVPNMCPVGRPFGYRNRVYQHYQYNVGFETAGASAPVTSNAIGYCYHALAELNIGEATRQPIKMAALWDVGLAVPANTCLRMGSCSGSHVLADGVTYAGMYPLMVEAVPGEQTADIRIGSDEVRWTFDAAVQATPVYPGCCVIGGGFVAWYDGVQTSELHLPAPPHIDNLVENNSVGAMVDDTYTYVTVLERVDAAGVLHRSPPSAPQGIAITGGTPQSVEVEPRTVQLTHHPRRHLGWRAYRSDTSDPTYTRASFSNDFGACGELLDYCSQFNDLQLGGTGVAQLYTTGGILESVSPEGAQLLVVARDRLWGARFFRRSRVQYSQTLAPSSAGETAVAPQMMELLGRIIPSGETLYGLSRTDDATVLFGERTIYAISGTGPNAAGANDDMSRAIEVPADAGCNEPRSVVDFPGGVMYRSPRCFYTFDRSHQVRDTGNRVEVRTLTDAYPTVTSAVRVPEKQHLRFTCNTAAGGDGIILVFDYGNGEFYEWNVLANGGASVALVGGAYVGGVYYAIQSDGTCWQESSEFVDDTTQFIEMDVWSGWVQPSGPLSWHRFGMVSPLGERREAAQLQLRVYTDYDDSAAANSITWTEAEIAALPAPTKRLGDLQRVPNIQQAQAMSFRFTDAVGSLNDSEGFALAGIGMDITTMGGAPRTTRVGQT